MRLVWVKYGKILPVDTGGKLRSFNLLKQLDKTIDLTFFSYYGGPRDSSYESEIAAELPGAVAVHAPDVPSTTTGVLLRLVRTAASPVPVTVSRFTSLTARARLSILLRDHQFDVALCDFLAPTLVLAPSPDVASQGPVRVLFEHNVESDLWHRRAEAEQRWHLRPVYRWESRRILRWEIKMLRRYDHVLAVSAHDRDRFEELAPGTDACVVPTGVDLEQFHPIEGQEPSPGLVVFVGSMDWEPNVDGIAWFCEAIWPLIRSRRPGARFRIVGRSPSAAVRRWAGADIEVTGSVPSVVEHLRDAEVVVVPLRVGGGTRLKIYEAMATGAPVVSTTIGAEGLEVRDGRDVLLRDDPSPFADAVVGLLDDPGRRRQLAEAGRRHAVRFGWARVAEKVQRFLETATARPSSTC